MDPRLWSATGIGDGHGDGGQSEGGRYGAGEVPPWRRRRRSDEAWEASLHLYSKVERSYYKYYCTSVAIGRGVHGNGYTASATVNVPARKWVTSVLRTTYGSNLLSYPHDLLE